ncbi:hypothetical protein [Arthrobacter sp.]|uniref:hypothetical protein n=1 Tax=Arthrobacter sp. TaxID=1667 RepID=UPI0033952188
MPAMKHPALARSTTAAIAVALAAAISAGTVIVAVPASAAVSQAALTSSEKQDRQRITDVFNAMNALRAAKGLKPVRIGADASAVLQEAVTAPEYKDQDSIQYNKLIRGHTNMASEISGLDDRSQWANNRLLTDPATNVVGIYPSEYAMFTTAYVYPAVPSQTFDTAAAYFAYLDLPQLQGPAPKVLGAQTWGSTLTVNPGTWPAGTKLAYRWFHTNSWGYTYPVDDYGAGTSAGKTYAIGDNDNDKKLSVRVTATLSGRRAAVLFSDLTAEVKRAAAVVNTKAPSLSGIFEIGQKITVNPGVWEPGTTLTFQWGRGGKPLPDTASARTQVMNGDGQIFVLVTGSKPGKRSTTVATEIKTIEDLNFSKPWQVLGNPTEERDGGAEVGETLFAQFEGDWKSGTALTRHWTRDGKPIPGATGTSYTLTGADIGARITLTVTGTRAGSVPRTVAAKNPSEPILARRPAVVNSAKPIITGTGLVGEPLTVKPGTWTPGTRFAYQWYITKYHGRGGTVLPIEGATASTYVPTAADDGGEISLRMIGLKDGYDRLTLGFVGTAEQGVVKVHKDLVTPPAVYGNFAVGNTLTSAVWKSGATLKYQWKRAGAAIPGATGTTYKMTVHDTGKTITLTVTGSLTGHRTMSSTSDPTGPVRYEATQYMELPTFSWPRNGFPPVVGQTIRMISPGKWTAGAKLTYQWTRNGTPIKGATSSSYKLGAADVGKRVGVKVTGQAPDRAKIVFTDIEMPVLAR